MDRTPDKKQIFAVMKETALACGEIIQEGARNQVLAKTKTSFRDLVTEYDVKVQNRAISMLSAQFPDAGFISEEQDKADNEKKTLTFVIDPIDGTANFVHQCHHSCVSIACVENGKPVAAAVYDPFSRELFSAVQKEGAFLNGEKLSIPEHELKDTLVLFGSSPYYPELADHSFRDLRMVFGRCQDFRRSGSAALDLAWVAAGRGGLFFERVLSVWDYAAGALLVTEAGGIVLSMNGEELIYDRPVKSSVIAGRSEIIAESGLLLI